MVGMAKLIYFPCPCIRRGDAIVPGSRGTLAIVTAGKMTVCAPCPRCKT